MPIHGTGSARDVGTSGLAIDGSILALQGRRGPGWGDEGNCGADEGDREKQAGHGRSLRCSRNVGALPRLTLGASPDVDPAIPPAPWRATKGAHVQPPLTRFDPS